MSDDVEADPVEASFVERMVRSREDRGYSQADLVRRLRENGWQSVHPTTISRIEKRERPVRIGEAARIATALGVELDELLPRTPNPQRDFDRAFASAQERIEAIQGATVGMSTYLLIAKRVLDTNPDMLAAMRFPPDDRVPSTSTEYLAYLADGFSTAKPKWQMSADTTTRDLILGVAVAAVRATMSAEGDSGDDPET